MEKSIRAMATLCSGGSVRTYSKRRSFNPGIRSKSSVAILAQAFFVRPFALRVLLSRASSRPPWCCFRQRTVKQELSRLGHLSNMPRRRRPQRNRTRLGRSGDLRNYENVVAYGEINNFDRVKGKRAQNRRREDGEQRWGKTPEEKKKRLGDEKTGAAIASASSGSALSSASSKPPWSAAASSASDSVACPSLYKWTV